MLEFFSPQGKYLERFIISCKNYCLKWICSSQISFTSLTETTIGYLIILNYDEIIYKYQLYIYISKIIWFCGTKLWIEKLNVSKTFFSLNSILSGSKEWCMVVLSSWSFGFLIAIFFLHNNFFSVCCQKSMYLYLALKMSYICIYIYYNNDLGDVMISFQADSFVAKFWF